MKKALITVLAIVFCVTLAGVGESREDTDSDASNLILESTRPDPQKYQLDFTLRYNAVDAETMAAILKVLEGLRESVGEVEIEPCVWKIKADGGAGSDTRPANFLWFYSAD